MPQYVVVGDRFIKGGISGLSLVAVVVVALLALSIVASCGRFAWRQNVAV